MASPDYLGVTTPYTPYVPNISPARSLYSSTVQVLRLSASLNADFGMSVTWAAVDTIVDVLMDTPGILQCRLDIGYLRPGKDQLPPIVAGRPQDRFGVIYFDPVLDASGNMLVKAGDRFLCVSGPISGTWEMRNIPDQLQGYRGAAHCEAQVVEVAAQNGPGTPTPFGT